MSQHEISRRTVLQGALGGALLIGAGGLLTACAPPASSGSGAGGSGGVLRVGLVGGGQFDDISDPKLAQTDIGFARMQALYDALGRNSTEFKLENQLAESFEPNADASVWTVRIKKGVEFHNGKTLTAADVIFSVQRAVDPSDPAIMAGSLLPYVDPAQITKVDDNTIRFTLTGPASFFPDRMSNWGMSIVPADFNPNAPVGTGAFKFVSMVPGDRSVYERFNNYWGEKAIVDRLEIIDFADATAAVNALISGQLDAIGSVPSGQFKAVEGAGASLLVAKNAQLPGFVMRTDTAPFNDNRVREAFRLLVDRDQMVKQALNGYGAIGNDMLIPSGNDYPADLPQRVYDPEKAKSLLAAAGQSGMTVRLPSAPNNLSWVQLAPEQFKAGGVTVQVDAVDGNAFFANEYLKAPFSNGQSPRQNGLIGISSTLFNPRLNGTHWNDERTTQLFNKAMQTIDITARDAIVRDMQTIQYHEGGYINWGFSDLVSGIGSHVTGFKQNSAAMIPLNNFIFNQISVN
ncbi:ABC transporter substrate-binding protein [Microbacterium deminutum]|uniref:ABC transporter substrate-binding protein n=1 Tax=Microbacterium deminutum TaxID=344164 RepID=A0ABN2RHY4_9MICO